MSDSTSADIYSTLIPALVKLKKGEISANQMIKAAWKAQKDKDFAVEDVAEDDELLTLGWARRCSTCLHVVPKGCLHDVEDCRRYTEDGVREEIWAKEFVWGEIQNRESEHGHRVFHPVQFEEQGLSPEKTLAALSSLTQEGKLKAFIIIYDDEGESIWRGPVGGQESSGFTGEDYRPETVFELPD